MNAIATWVSITILVLSACATATVPLAAPPGADSTAAAHNEEGIEQYRLQRWGTAKTHFSAAMQSNPQMAEAHYNLALALDQLGDHGEATVHFKKAAELAPGNPAITQSDAYLYHVQKPGPPQGLPQMPRPTMGGY